MSSIGARIALAIGAVLAGLLGVAIITEQIFSLPGLGSLAISSVVDADLPLIVRDGVLLLECRADAGRWGLVGGAVDAHESLHDALCREVAEETGLVLSAVRYVASQPWPFPRSLMLGFVARAAGTEIEVDGVEIEHARWFSRDELNLAVTSGAVGLPGEASIAHRIVAEWRAGTLPAPEG